MKKISLLLILLCSYLSFAQLENYPITYVGLIYSSDIRGVDNVLTVPKGKVWKVISGRTIFIVAPNSGERFISSFIGYETRTTTTNGNSTWMKNMVIPSGFQVYTNTDDSVFNYIEYDISQQLSHAEPKIDNRPTLYPNPTSSLLALNSDKEYDIEVYDMAGNKLMALSGNNINMSHLSTATYIVKATDKSNNEELTYKVVKN